MKPWLVAYSSLTGNTKKIGEAIWKVLPAGSDVFSVDEEHDWRNYEYIAVGYWVDKGTLDSKAMEYMEKITSKKVFVFATLGAYPDGDHAKSSLAKGVELMKENGNEVIGEFICQGRLSEAIMNRMKSFGPDHPHGVTEERRKRWEIASQHPNEEDFEAVQELIRKVFEIESEY